jgi:endonuclease/exonuclease/phosphatase family metal-dependent hydrolase
MSVRGRGGRHRGVALAGAGTPLRSLVAFPDVPLPEKVLAGWLEIDGEPTTVVSYHAPPGVTYGLRKPEQALQLAQWLKSVSGPALVAGDFNTPKIDPPDVRKLRTHWHTGDSKLRGAPGDDLLVGPKPIHSLRDALRTYLGTNRRAFDEISSLRPSGPLRVSHRTGKQRDPRRYDAIWASPHFTVDDVTYLYEEAISAGSDHALVVAELQFRRRRDEVVTSGGS